jgi:hypothetical protein
VQTIKDQVRTVVGGVLAGKLDRGAGALAIQGFNTLLRCVEVERKLREQDEVLARIEALERQREMPHHRRQGGRFGS